MKPTRIIHLVAHRGNAHDCPENSLPAIRSALDLGVRFVSVDVHLSQDGVPIVVRDDTLLRTGERDLVVGEHEARMLARQEVAERARFGNRFAGTLLPRLGDVLALLDGRPEVTLFIDVQRDCLARFGHEQVIARLLEALHAHRSQCVIVSGDLPAVFRMRQVGGLRIGWVLAQHDSHTRLKYEALQPEFLFCDHRLLQGKAPLWRGPWQWVVTDVTTLEAALELAARGADFIATRAVRAMSDAMRAHAVQR